MADTRLKAIIEAEDRASATFGRVSDSLASMGKVALKFGAVAGAALVGAGAYALKSAGDMQLLRQSFDTMLGSAEKGRKVFGDLAKMAAKTPFETQDLAQASQVLLSYGINAEKLLPTLNMLGDVSLGNKDKFNQLALAFGQVSAAGKLNGQDLRQMIAVGFNPLQKMAQRTGVSYESLLDKMQKGQITFDMVSKEFEIATQQGGMFFQGMEKGSKTLPGLISTLKDNVMTLARSLVGFDEYGDVVKGGLLDKAGNAIIIMSKWIQDNQATITTWGQKIVGILSYIPPFVEMVKTKFQEWWPIIQQTAMTIWSYLQPSISALFTALGNLVTKLMEFWNANKSWIIPTLQWLAMIIGTIVVVAIKLIIDAFTWLINNAIIPLIGWVQGSLIPALVSIYNLVAPVFIAFWNLVKQVFGYFMSNVWPMISSFLSLLSSMWSATWEAIKTVLTIVWEVIKSTIQNALNTIKGVFTAATQILKGDWKGAFETMKNVIGDNLGRAKDTAKNILDSIVGFFKDLPGRIADALKGLGSVISNALSGVKGSLGSLGIPGFASGTSYAPGGLAMVGEQGPELVNLPRGSKVTPAGETSRIVNNSMGGVSINIYSNQNAQSIAQEVSRILARQNQVAMMGGMPAYS